MILKKIIDLVCFLSIVPSFFRKKRKIHGVRKLLIMNMCGIGDILALTPLLETLKQTHKYEIYLLSAGPTRKIFENDKTINIIHFKFGLKNTIKNMKIINSYKFDMIFNSFREEYNALLVCLSNAKYKCGYLYSSNVTTNNFNIPLDSNLYPCKFFLSYDVRKCALNLARILNIENLKESGDYNIILNKENFVKISSMLPKSGYKNLIVLFADNQRWARSWSLKKWDRLINYLIQDKNNFVILVGTNKANEKNSYLIEKYIKIHNFLSCVDELNILETGALLSIVDIFITPDGGPMHLAFAAGCKKVIGLFGPTNPDCVFINRKGYVVLYDRGFMPKVNKYFLPLTNRTISIKLSDVLKSI